MAEKSLVNDVAEIDGAALLLALLVAAPELEVALLGGFDELVPPPPPLLLHAATVEIASNATHSVPTRILVLVI